MIDFIIFSFASLMTRGGLVMWPLLGLSFVAVTLTFERAWFFLRTNRRGQLAQVDRMASLLRQGQRERAQDLAASDDTVYGDLVRRLLAEGTPGEALATEAVEAQRRRLERFMPTLSTIITAAPMLGILGTVLGIIASFEILSADSTVTDPRSVSQGIAEALITTAAGLVVAVVVLFPYNAFRAQVDRTLSRIEALAAAAIEGRAAASTSEMRK